MEFNRGLSSTYLTKFTILALHVKKKMDFVSSHRGERIQHVGAMAIGFQFIKKEKLKEELFRSNCMFAHRFKHFPLSGILAFMREIIGHSFVLNFSNFSFFFFAQFSIIRENILW